ncbi:Metal transporter Nramp2 [Hibiscus syriacus]|uniref:RING-type E3 ubiquitin transferase n=1 Tax=Hibiscus syriacus TaxID=106335 RepID=A0A6A3BI79_HIBSY|nr:Metal transporter Nramp2 [Hibiscus syriacus]
MLSARLGVATRRHLAELCREEYPTWGRMILWVMAELALIGVDIQEVIGSAIAIKILMRKLEAFFAVLIATMAVSFAWMFGQTKPSGTEILLGVLIPKHSSKSIKQAVRVVGCIIMPHNVFLHSALVPSNKLNPVRIPPEFICPLSLEIMADPVIVASGHTYDGISSRNGLIWADRSMSLDQPYPLLETEVKKLVDVLKSPSIEAQREAQLISGSPVAKENTAAALFSLSVNEDYRLKIGRTGAIKPLVDMLRKGWCRKTSCRVDATISRMVDKAVFLLAKLAVLVEVVELGSERGKENAAAALLLLCTYSNRYCNLVLKEGAVPPYWHCPSLAPQS